jgi:ribonuclease BN (tRNA processing enzyme)
MMRVEVLGCSGGIGGASRTTALRVDHDILIDCGTGVGDLPLEGLVRIDHVFLSHGHLDHVCLLPMLADAGVGRRALPLTAYALPETITTLKDCLFNGRVWPDYTALPAPEHPYLRLQPITVGTPVVLGSRRITPVPVRHAVPAVGYRLDSGEASLVFSGDTTFSEAFWDAVNAMENLCHLIMETTFLNDNEAGCRVSGHTNARLLAQGLARLTRPVSLHITHMEPGREEQTWAEVMQAAASHRPARLQRGQVIEF